MTKAKKPQVTGDGAVELEETELDRASGGAGLDGISYNTPPNPGGEVGIIAVNKFNPGAIGSVKLRPGG